MRLILQVFSGSMVKKEQRVGLQGYLQSALTQNYQHRSACGHYPQSPASKKTRPDRPCNPKFSGFAHFVNRELDELKAGLEAVERLYVQAVFCRGIISFAGDRIVKRFQNSQSARSKTITALPCH